MKNIFSIGTRALACLVLVNFISVLPASAQTATTSIAPGTTAPVGAAKKIGPAPANSAQHKILTSALSPETRQTLQKAMEATPEPAK